VLLEGIGRRVRYAVKMRRKEDFGQVRRGSVDLSVVEMMMAWSVRMSIVMLLLPLAALIPSIT
jgi:hypothetical protein